MKTQRTTKLSYCQKTDILKLKEKLKKLPDEFSNRMDKRVSESETEQQKTPNLKNKQKKRLKTNKETEPHESMAQY